MKELTKISCYIEEYKNQNGKLCARLRDGLNLMGRKLKHT